MGQGNSQMRKISSAAQWKGGEAPGQSVGYIGVGLNSYWAAGPEPPPPPTHFLDHGARLSSLFAQLFSYCLLPLITTPARKKIVRSCKPLNPCSS